MEFTFEFIFFAIAASIINAIAAGEAARNKQWAFAVFFIVSAVLTLFLIGK